MEPERENDINRRGRIGELKSKSLNQIHVVTREVRGKALAAIVVRGDTFYFSRSAGAVYVSDRG